MDDTPMTNEQSWKMELLTRLDELNRIEKKIKGKKVAKKIKKRKKVLREALDKPLST